MLNNISISSIAAIILSVMIGGGIYIWKKNVEDQAVIEYVKAQQEQIIKEQEKLINDMSALQKEQVEIVADLKDRALVLEKKFKSFEEWLSAQPTTKSSEVLRRTFKELSQ